MSIKDLVFHLDTSDTGQRVTDFAISLAQSTGAHLTAAGLAVQYLGPGGLEDAGGYEALMELTEQSRKATELAYQNLLAQAPAGLQTDFVLIEALAAIARDRFGALARHFDLSIVGQGSGEAADEDGLMVEGALLGSGRPVFVVPAKHQGGVQLEKAMVCWNGSAVAARALAGALPLLKRASVVEVVDIMRADDPLEELPGFNITRHLARHGINATLRRLPNARSVSAALLSHASDSGADYLVMGGYGHWRLREFVFGGTTRSILSSMTVPVLMAH